MTKVRFTFVDVQGNPLPLLEFKILLRRASFNIEDVGVALPEELNVTTDASGQVVVELWPLKAAYRVQVADEYEELCGKLNWSFYVPQTDEIIEAQTLFLVPPPSNIPWDEEAMGKITQAVQDTQDNKEAAEASAVRAETAATTIEGDADRAEAAAAAAELSKNAAAGSANMAGTAAVSAVNSRDAAQGHAATAAGAASAAGNSATAAQQSATQASASAQSASTSATTATNAKDAAALSAQQALTSKNSAETSAGTATTKAAEALTSANNSASSASTALTQANRAKTEADRATAATDDKQDKNANLTAFSGLVGAVDKLPYFTGVGALALGTLTSKARELLAYTTEAQMLGWMKGENTLPIPAATSQVDLNTLTTKRTDYYINDGINTPVAANGYLTVIPLIGGTECHQTYRRIGGIHGTGTYERTCYGGAWTPWVQVIRAGDFGLGSQNVPVIANFADNILPGFYFTYGSGHASAPINGPASTGGGTVGIIALQGINNAGYKSFLGVSQYGGPPDLFVGSKVITGGAPTWNRVITQESATLDPALATGGLMSSTTVNGFIVSKYANGQMHMQGALQNVDAVPANTYVHKTVTIPTGFASSILPVPHISLAAFVSNDHFGVVSCYMASSTTISFVIRNGSLVQGFGLWLSVWGRWK